MAINTSSLTDPAALAGDAGAATGVAPAFSPLYQQIKVLILQSLQAGEWKPGEAIPSEMDLAARFRVSQGTVRKAIDELAAENLVVRRQGKGTFVATHAEQHVLAHYPSALLDTFMAVTMTATLTTYSLFATSPEAQLQHGERLLYTVPVVIFGMLRYTYQVHRGHGEDVARDLLRDPWILGAGALWLTIFLSRWL